MSRGTHEILVGGTKERIRAAKVEMVIQDKVPQIHHKSSHRLTMRRE